MRVAYGITALAKGINGAGIDGIGNYTKELYSELNGISDLELFTYSYGVNAACTEFGNTRLYNKYSIELVKCMMFPRAQMNSSMGEEGVDLIHSTDHLIPYVKNVPVVSTIMDAIPLSNPEWVNTSLYNRLRIKLWGKIVNRSDHILTISDYSRSEISKYFKIGLDKISVVPLGVDSRFFNEFDKSEKIEVLNKYGLKKPYCICIGTVQPRKNIERLLEAMRLLPRNLKASLDLVIVGRYGWGCNDLIDDIAQAENEGWCKWIKYVPDYDLRGLLQSASTLVFPSLYEGFGLPVLEGFASRVPVIASNITSIPEVAGDAAILVNPFDSLEISTAIMRIVNDDVDVCSLLDKGVVRARSLTWEKSAAKTYDVYKKVICDYS